MLLVVVIVFYGQILQFLGLVEPAPEQPATGTEVTTQTEPSTQTTQPIEPAQGAVEIERAPDRTAIVDEQADSLPPDTIIINTSKYTVTLSSFGGGPVSIKLKEYFYRNGDPIEMLPGATSVTPEATFAGGTFSTSRVRFNSDLQPGTYDATRDTVEVTYTYSNGQGGQIIRTLRFYPDQYHFDLSVGLVDTRSLGFERNYRLIWNTPLGVTEPQAGPDYQAMQAVTMQGGSRESLDDFEDGRLNQSREGTTAWVGVRSKYFTAVLIPQREVNSVFASGIEEEISAPEGTIKARHITAGMEMAFAPTEMLSDTIRVYVGPMDYLLMADYDVGMEDMMDIGTAPFVGWIIKPFAIGIMWLLPRLYDFLPNYGLVIILFALMVKIITLPLSMKSFKSMQAMKELQPKIEELKVKHKKNPQAMNQEMMRLYKKHGVSPISGCLPMLPQMPLFIAMFRVFQATILLRDAPFIWFISDLSRGATGFTDPYIILVVIMIVTQFLYQKLTMPSTQQNKMIGYMMPLFFGFIFYKFAAGLVLYWICFSLFSLLDYVLFKRPKNVEVKTA